MMRTLIAITLILVVGASGWFLGAQFGGPDLPGSGDQSFKHGPAGNIHGIGKLLPKTGIIQIVAPPGEKVESLFGLKVGQTVDKDQVLVQLNARQARQIDLDVANARRMDAQNKLAFETEQAQFRKKAAELALAEAQTARKIAENLSMSLDLLLKQQQAANQTLQRLTRMKANPATSRLVNQSDIDKQRLLLEQLDVQTLQAKQEKETAVGKAERAIAAANIELETVQFVIDQSQRAIPEQTLNQAVEAAQLGLDLTTIKAPSNGVVLDIALHPGDTVTNQPVMLIADTSKMVCIAEIIDSRMRDVQENAKVTITSDALAEPLSGRVISKGVMIGPPSLQDPNPFAQVDRKTGEVVIELKDSALARQFINLQVEVEIEFVSLQSE